MRQVSGTVRGWGDSVPGVGIHGLSPGNGAAQHGIAVGQDVVGSSVSGNELPLTAVATLSTVTVAAGKHRVNRGFQRWWQVASVSGP